MLNHHSDIAWCSEFEYSVDCVSENGEFPPLDFYYEWLSVQHIFQLTQFVIDPQLNYLELVNSFLLQQQHRQKKRLIGATVHRHFDRLLHIWPNARFIHLIRDGRDVARSCIGMGWAGNSWVGVNRWLEAEQLWDKVQSTISVDRYIQVKFEDLITEPMVTLSSLCQFMDLDFDESMLQYSATTTYDKPNPKLVEQWRYKMRDQDIQLVEAKVSTLLLDRGYELSGLPKLQVTDLALARIKFQDWWYKLNFRIQRYGFGLTFSNFLSRRLGLKDWEKQTTLQINEILVSYLK